MKRTAAVILAAGFSSRLGNFKPLLELGGQTLLARAVGLFRQTGVERILVVCGHRGEEVAKSAESLGAMAVFNPDHARGMVSSVLIGLAALEHIEACQAAWVLPVDIPLIRPGTLWIALEEWAKGQPPVVIPTFGGQPGHPPLLDAAVWPSVLDYSGEGGLRGALSLWRESTVNVPCGDRGVLMDLDTPEDLAALQARAARPGVPDRQESDELARQVLAMDQNLLAHGNAVANCALRLAGAMPSELDDDLLYAAGLLHDLAKGQPDHAEAGARRLADMGLEPVARAVAGHMDLPPRPDGRLTEAELICLADKCLLGDRLVDPEQRYQAKLEKFRDDSEACVAIHRRLVNCRALRAHWERLAGRGLAQYLCLDQCHV